MSGARKLKLGARKRGKGQDTGRQ